MSKDIINFVKEFNEELEKVKVYSTLDYLTNGYSEVVVFPQICLWGSDSMSEKYAKQVILSNLVKTIEEVLKISKQELCLETDVFFAEKRKEFSEKFTQAKLNISSNSAISYKAFVFGKYNEDIMYNFLDDMKEDFQHIFEGCKLEFDLQ